MPNADIANANERLSIGPPLTPSPAGGLMCDIPREAPCLVPGNLEGNMQM